MSTIRASHCGAGKLHGILGQIYAAIVLQCDQAQQTTFQTGSWY